MALIQVGNTTVDMVPELIDDANFKPDRFLPTHDPAALASHLSWLESGHISPITGSLILSVYSWLVRTEHHTILIDTCVGNHKQRAPAMPDWHDLDTPYLENLAGHGVAPEDIDFVMCTHLHVDHVGWNTQLIDGRWVPTFPNAKYLFSKADHDYWSGSESRFAQAVYQDSVLPVVETGQALMVDDGHQIDDSFTVDLAPGHTPGSIAIHLESATDRVVFSGDIIHSPIQIYYPNWSSSACVDAQQSAVTRRRILEAAVENNELLLPAHFTAPHGGKIRPEGDAFSIDWLAH